MFGQEYFYIEWSDYMETTMAEYHGMFRTSFSYLKRSFLQTGGLLITLAAVCFPTVVPFVLSGGRTGVFALFGFFGLVAYLGQLAVNDELATVDEQTDSKIVGYILTILVILYYNCLIFMSVFFATTFTVSGFEQYALGVAMLYPFYDIEMTEMAAPLSIGGAFVFSVAVIAWGLRRFENILNIRYCEDELDSLSHIKDWGSVLRDFVLLKSHTLTRRYGRSS